MGAKIGLILFIIILLAVGVYVYSSGALVNGWRGFNTLVHAPSSTFSFFKDFNIFSTSTPSARWPSSPTIASPSSGSGAGSAVNPAINPADIPAGYTAAQLSPYFREVTFGGVSAGTYYSYGTITLNAYFNNGTTGAIDVTGWQIKTNVGDEYIPQAVNLYDPTGLAPAGDIDMKNGNAVFLYSSSAPFNLRLNECTGYMAHVATFVPALPLTCPSVGRSQLQELSGACQDFVNSIGQCQTPNMSSPRVPQGDYACMNYLQDNFTYRSCFDQHSADANFLSNQIWVWTGSSPVGQYHDTVRLLDKNGLLVDMYSY